METNQFFNLKRFYLLLRNDLMINHKKYLYALISAVIGGTAILYLTMPKTVGRGVFEGTDYLPAFIICLFALGAFAGMSFPDMNSKIKASKYLLLPSSIFEKYLSQFLVRIVLASLFFMLVFWIDTFLARFISLAIYKDVNASMIKNFDLHTLITLKSRMTLTSTLFAGFSMGTFLFSVRLFFKKNALVKTVVTFLVLSYATACLVVIFSHLFYPETRGFDVKLDIYTIEWANMKNMELWMNSLAYLGWLFLLPLGYFKLKEKEI